MAFPLRNVLLSFGLFVSCSFDRGDVVTEWNSLLLDAIRNEDTGAPLAARNLAILHAAIYDAVNSIDAKYEPYFVIESAPPGTPAEVAAVSAAHTVLVDLYPSQ